MDTIQFTQRYAAYLQEVLRGLPAEMPLDRVKERLREALEAAATQDVATLTERALAELGDDFRALDEQLELLGKDGEAAQLEEARKALGAVSA